VEYRIDELAQVASTSVRNVRVYQERGLLPPPRRVGRTGLYSEAHLARLKLIRLLLQRGYTFATIGELIEAWSAGQGIAELIGLDGAIAVPWSDETPELHDEASLAASYGPYRPEDLQRLTALGIVSLEPDGVRVPSPKLLEAGAQLVAAGVPLTVVLDLGEELAAQMDQVARLFFKWFDTHVAQDGRPAGEVVESLITLRPFAQRAVGAMLAIALNRQSARLIERRAEQARQSAAASERDVRALDDHKV